MHDNGQVARTNAYRLPHAHALLCPHGIRDHSSAWFACDAPDVAVFGVAPWTAVIAGLLLACPIAVVWALLEARSKRQQSLGCEIP